MSKTQSRWRMNLRLAKRFWGPITPIALNTLRHLTRFLSVSIAAGDLHFLDNGWYVTHGGLLRIAQRRRCCGIETVVNEHLSDPNVNRWVFKATVLKTPNCRGFTGYGDANPSNVSSIVHGAEMRIAETRAVNRALRKAYGIGICSVEELGAPPASKSLSNRPHDGHSPSEHDTNNGQPRLRDQLCILIRQHNLNPTLVKAYAADFCGTDTLSGASRELVESFISHLATAAKENRDSLVCRLNSYAQPQAANQ
jgi:hypothetical protein